MRLRHIRFHANTVQPAHDAALAPWKVQVPVLARASNPNFALSRVREVITAISLWLWAEPTALRAGHSGAPLRLAGRVLLQKRTADYLELVMYQIYLFMYCA